MFAADNSMSFWGCVAVLYLNVCKTTLLPPVIDKCFKINK